MASRAKLILDLCNYCRRGALGQVFIVDALQSGWDGEATHREGETNEDLVARLIAADRRRVEQIVVARAREVMNAGKATLEDVMQGHIISGGAWWGVAVEICEKLGSAEPDRFIIVERHGYPDEADVLAFSCPEQAATILAADYPEAVQQDRNIRLVCEDGDGDRHLDY